MTITLSHPGRQVPAIEVHAVGWTRPLHWLASGWRDLRLHPMASLGHGLVVALLWFLLLGVAGTHPYAIASLVSCFMLLGPVLASGLCELSRRQETGQALTFEGSVEGMSANSDSLMRFSAVLAAVTVIWFVISAVLLQQVLGRPGPSLGEIQYSGFLAAWHARDLGSYVAIGGVLAAVVLALSVVAVPLMLATLLLGLVVVVPVMGHATWHAYRDMVTPANQARLREAA